MQNYDAMNTFSENVKAVLTRKKMSMRELARKLDMASGNLSKILSCKEGITLERAARIADALEVPLWWLLKNSVKISVGSA
jgi:transcriptional regulator with XRE-family HTH domain